MITLGIETQDLVIALETEMTTVVDHPARLYRDGAEQHTETATGKAIVRRDTAGVGVTAAVAVAALDGVTSRILVRRVERS